MFRTFKNSFYVSFTETVNVFIYFIRRFPFLSKEIPESIYKGTNSKIIIGIIAEIIKLFTGFFGKAIYIGLMIIVPILMIDKEHTQFVPLFFHMLFVLSFVFGTLANSEIVNENKTDFNMIVLMKSNPREYYLSKIIFKRIIFFIQFFVPIMITGLVVGFSPIVAFIVTLEMTLLRFFGEVIQLYVFSKKSKSMLKDNVLAVITIIVTLLCAYGLPVIKYVINFKDILVNPFVVCGILALSMLSLRYLFKYKKFKEVSKKILTKENIFLKDTVPEMNFATVKIDEKKLSKEDLNGKRFEGKKGYSYLNSIFFDRHKKILVSPIIMRIVIIAILFIAGIFVTIFFPDKHGEMFGLIKNSTPTMVFIMYILSTGDRICKAMFYNCDNSLLRYSYYRDGKVILSNFTVRLKMSVLLNILPAIALCLGLCGFIIADGFATQIIYFVPEILCILCLACFFSIHNLVIYYVLQPYTSELTIKSPLFTIANYIVYIVSYMCLQMETTSLYFTVGVLFVTLAYMVIGLFITYKVAPKTFKLRV